MRSRAKSFMQSLIYPAFLGTFIVSFVRNPNAWEAPLNVDFWLAVFLLSYFVVLFLEAEYANKYNVLTLIFDLLEVAGMSLAFYFLGTGALPSCFGVFGIVVLLSIPWRWSTGEQWNFFLLVLTVAAAATSWTLGGWLAWPVLALSLLYMFLGGYVGHIAYMRITWRTLRSGEGCVVAGRYRLIEEDPVRVTLGRGDFAPPVPGSSRKGVWALEQVGPLPKGEAGKVE